MVAAHNRRPSEWERLFSIACNLIDHVQQQAGHTFGWSFGGGTAMMLQIGHRESHDVDIFLDDPQILGFLDPSKVDLHFDEPPASYGGDGARFQKFAFTDIGEIDFIATGHLTSAPFVVRQIWGRAVQLESIPEIIAKKVYHRGSEAKARDVFDIAAAARSHRFEVIAALKHYPDRVAKTLDRLDKLNPEFVDSTIRQLIVLPDFLDMAPQSLNIAKSLLREALAV
jgi:pimeloyl-ACP methyl ester carboxylesterase